MSLNFWSFACGFVGGAPPRPQGASNSNQEIQNQDIKTGDFLTWQLAMRGVKSRRGDLPREDLK